MAHDALTAEFSARSRSGSDIHEHLPVLSALAQVCGHVTEFGVRGGNSTIALLHGLALDDDGGELASYDLMPHGIECVPYLPPTLTWRFSLADTSTLSGIAPTDFLFIDTLHTCAQVAAELRHAPRVRKYIAFHDTVLFGWHDEAPGTGPGIMQAIFDFLGSAEGSHWHVVSHAPRNNGLLILARHQPPTHPAPIQPRRTSKRPTP